MSISLASYYTIARLKLAAIVLVMIFGMDSIWLLTVMNGYAYSLKSEATSARGQAKIIVGTYVSHRRITVNII